MYSVARRMAHQTQGQEQVKVVQELERVTVSQLIQFFHTCQTKFIKAKIEPGEYSVYSNISIKSGHERDTGDSPE